MQLKTPSFPRLKNPSMTKSQTKTMLITSFNVRSIVHLEFTLQGEAVSQADYTEILTILHVAVIRKIPELWCNNWFLFQEDVPAHHALCVSHVTAARSTAGLEHTPNSPDLAPS
jgi:hypothetical protein